MAFWVYSDTLFWSVIKQIWELITELDRITDLIRFKMMLI